MAPEAERPGRRAEAPWRAFVGRLALAHFIAYPVGFAAAVAAMPVAFLLREQALLHAGDRGATSSIVREATRGMSLSGTEGAQLQIILEFVLWATLAVLAVVHLAALPWCLGAARTARDPLRGAASLRTGRRTFVGITLATAVLVVLCAVGGWMWIFLL